MDNETLQCDPPSDVVVADDCRQIRLFWEDMMVSSISSDQLRAGCRCAWCTRDRITGGFPTSFSATEIIGVDVYGAHGLHIRFSDGHERGIYPWSYLKILGAGAVPVGEMLPDSATVTTGPSGFRSNLL